MSGLLTAVNEETDTKVISFEISDDAGYETDWLCPVCGGAMYYKKQSVDGRVSHFCHKTAGDHPRLSEGKLHSTMKQRIYEVYNDSARVTDVDIEYPVGGDYFENPDRIADVYVQLNDGTDVAIEIQCSSQSVEAFEDRTASYNEHGFHVLWLVQEETYLPPKASQDGAITGVAYKDSVKWLQRHYYGRVYAFNEESADIYTGYFITPTRVQSVSTIKEGYDEYSNYQSYRYTYKTLGEKSTGRLQNLNLLATESQGKRIARFYDKCWWKGDTQ